ncbi:hypothetical protein lerEdw1_013537 [Lerista edwardsae]|nr:hypothetical protein lerEdw1_013537 [Lerista edwardsae]
MLLSTLVLVGPCATLHWNFSSFHLAAGTVSWLVDVERPPEITAGGKFRMPVEMAPLFHCTVTGSGKKPDTKQPKVTSEALERSSQQGDSGNTDGAVSVAVR